VAYPRGQGRKKKLLESGDWLTDGDLCAWQETVLCHDEVDEPRAWSQAATYVEGLVRHMHMYAQGKYGNAPLTWRRRHFFICNSVATDGEHWFVCAFDCKTGPEDFVVYIYEAMDTQHYMGKLTKALGGQGIQFQPKTLGFQTDYWSCGYQSLNIVEQLTEHRGALSAFQPTAMPVGFVALALEIVNRARQERVVVTPRELSDPSGCVEEIKPPSK
jgi:hypothetical protein